MMNWTAEEQYEQAIVGWTVKRLTKLPRGIDEVLAHLYVQPKTLAELHQSIAQLRLQDDKSETRRSVPDSALFDVGHLAVAGILHSDEEGRLHVYPSYREGVRVFLRAAFLHPSGGQVLRSAIRNATEAPVVGGEG